MPLEKGPDYDEFFLTFDKLASHTFDRPAPVTPPPPTAVDLRRYRRSACTRSTRSAPRWPRSPASSQLDSSVNATFGTVRQSLPADCDLTAVLASHQVAIAQLAIEYCDALVENQHDAAGHDVPGLPLQRVGASLGIRQRDPLFVPLLTRAGGDPAASQPDEAASAPNSTTLVNGIPGDPTRLGLLSSQQWRLVARADPQHRESGVLGRDRQRRDAGSVDRALR